MILQLNSINRFLADGVQSVFPFTFAGGYISQAHVKVYVTDEEGVRVFPEITFPSAFQVSILPAPATGHVVTVYRDTPKDKPLVEFTDGTALTEAALNLIAQQAVFVAAEFTDATTTVLDDGALEPYGFKDMKHITYAGASTVNLGDRGRNHVKADGTAVTVPGMYVGFTCNIFNTHDTLPVTVTFAHTAYLQGTDESKATWELVPNQILHVTQAATNKFFISGMAE